MQILLMDDKDQVRSVTKRMLEFLGHVVVAVPDGDQAIESFRLAHESDNKFDLVILDLKIDGGKGGMETLVFLKEIDPSIAAVASSGFSDDASKAECKELGFKWFLSKPMTLAELQAVLLDIRRSRK